MMLRDTNGIFRAQPRTGLAVDMDNRPIAYWNVKGPAEARNLDGLLHQIHLRVGQRLVRVEYQAFRVGLRTERDWAVFARPVNGSVKLLHSQVGQVSTLTDLLGALYRDSTLNPPLLPASRPVVDPRFHAFEQYNLW